VKIPFFVPLLLAGCLTASGQVTDSTNGYDPIAGKLLRAGLGRPGAYGMLERLTSHAGHRLSGSAGADTAVELAKRLMEERGFSNVHLEQVMVPRWERGTTEKAFLVIPGKANIPMAVCALGGSIATPAGGITAGVVEVRSFDELEHLGTAASGKIVFFNRPMDPSLLNTFEAYERAVEQRYRGAVQGAKSGCVAALVRSMTLAIDGVPHTGGMGYQDSVKKIPAAAISTKDAEKLSALLRAGEPLRVRLTLSCRTLPDAPSANVTGEITGTEKPGEVIVVGGHLDAWDKGAGAHDDGAGCVQAIEALDLIRTLGLKPGRTIRAVMFMNEENGLRGGRGYVADPLRRSEKHIAMIESDAGGFAPRGFFVDADSAVRAQVLRWKPVMEKVNAGRLLAGRSGADISPMVAAGVPGFGLDPENHRYFDYHHSDKDTPDKVNPRELEMGAIAEALLAYMIAQEGLPAGTATRPR
jgi:Zn-dependent M28 family amino/carboxypeptidase